MLELKKSFNCSFHLSVPSSFQQTILIIRKRNYQNRLLNFIARIRPILIRTGAEIQIVLHPREVKEMLLEIVLLKK